MSGTENLLDQIESRIVKARLRDLKLLEKNARYMTPQEFALLVDNIKRDGKLTSTPVVYRGEVLSGNHRVRAAIKAGIEEADVIDILSELSEERRLAIQLSQNAINGKDDETLLKAINVARLKADEYSSWGWLAARSGRSEGFIKSGLQELELYTPKAENIATKRAEAKPKPEPKTKAGAAKPGGKKRVAGNAS